MDYLRGPYDGSNPTRYATDEYEEKLRIAALGAREHRALLRIRKLHRTRMWMTALYGTIFSLNLCTFLFGPTKLWLTIPVLLVVAIAYFTVWRQATLRIRSEWADLTKDKLLGLGAAYS